MKRGGIPEVHWDQTAIQMVFVPFETISLCCEQTLRFSFVVTRVVGSRFVVVMVVEVHQHAY